MRVSIIIPVYNVEAYIEECFKSVIAQTYEGEMECLIVDDCGTDNSMDIIQRLISEYDGPIKFKILNHNHNKGLSAARNTGIKVASGEYITFVDSDDKIFPDSIANFIEVAKRFPDAEIIQGDIFINKLQEDKKYMAVSPAIYPEYIEGNLACKRAMLYEMPVTAWGKLIKSSFIHINNLFFQEGRLCEDMIWSIITSRVVKKIAFCFTPVYYYRLDNTASIMHSSDKTKLYDSQLSIVEEIFQNSNIEQRIMEIRYAKSILHYERKNKWWNQIKDKQQITNRISRLKNIAKERHLPNTIRFMLKCLSLPVFVYNNVFFRKVYSYIISR